MAKINTNTGVEIVEMNGLNYTNIAGATTTVIKSGAGILGKIIINKPLSLSVTTVYDNTAGSGSKIGTIANPLTLLQQQSCLDIGVAFNNGLTITTSANDDITVGWA